MNDFDIYTEMEGINWTANPQPNNAKCTRDWGREEGEDEMVARHGGLLAVVNGWGWLRNSTTSPGDGQGRRKWGNWDELYQIRREGRDSHRKRVKSARNEKICTIYCGT